MYSGLVNVWKPNEIEWLDKMMSRVVCQAHHELLHSNVENINICICSIIINHRLKKSNYEAETTQTKWETFPTGTLVGCDKLLSCLKCALYTILWTQLSTSTHWFP